MKNVLVSISILLVFNTASAVMIAGPDGTINTTAPTGDQGWSYVGQINTAPSSSTYLDNNWFITAYHVKFFDNPTGVNLGGTDYTIADGSWTRITNSVDGTNADLVMYRVNENVGLAGIQRVSSTITNETSLTMIGNGVNRGNPYVQDQNTNGYYWGSGTSKRWGTNTKHADEGFLIDTNFGNTASFSTDWDDNPGEAQGVRYDSGGGAFIDDSGEIKLAGITINADFVQETPGIYYSLFGSKTYFADISSYNDQIDGIVAIPEPTVIGLIGLFGAAILAVKRIFNK